jgi:glyoxylase-like metal-dependent hydrolase (beta-lactamase superfamily II)
VSAHARFTIDADLLPAFTAAYLRTTGTEHAFLETNTSHAAPKLLAALAERGMHPSDVRWVVVTHAHLDHAGGAGVLLQACPNATLLAHPLAAKHLIDPAKLVQAATAVYGEERFRAMYGVIVPVPKERVRILEDGDTFTLGDATLRAIHTRGHANHHLIVHDPALSTVYTGDTFGLVYPALQRRGRFALPSTSPSNFDAPSARASVDRVVALGEASACLTHWGEVQDQREVAAQLHAWIDRAEGWLEDAKTRDERVEAATTRLAGLWRDAIREDADARGLGFGDAEWKHLELDIELNAQGLAVVARAKPRAPSAPRA